MPHTADEQSTVEQVLRVMDRWKAAFEAKSVDEMMSFYTEGTQFSAFDLMPPIEFRGGERWRDNWTTFFALWGAVRLEFADLEAHASGELAVVRLFSRLTGTMSGQEVDLWVRQTNCFRLVDGEWLMFHDHVSVPTDFATGRSLLGLSPDNPFG
ncbi:MAG: YybH family protein [Phycicoccus sp.]